MARPKKSRTVCFEPDITEFIKIKNNREFVEITVDEYETLRLIDYMGLTQMECALQMQLPAQLLHQFMKVQGIKYPTRLLTARR